MIIGAERQSAMSEPNPATEFYFAKDKSWSTERSLLRQIALSTGLSEELKWGHPCYTLDGANVVLMHCFKHYCALLFHKGVLLADPAGILDQQTENVQSARQIRFSSAGQIEAMSGTLRNYIADAIAVERAGTPVPMKSTAEFAMPQELLDRLDADPALSEAFSALTPGRQRGYLLYFSAAKQATTRADRIEKAVPEILAGRGRH